MTRIALKKDLPVQHRRVRRLRNAIVLLSLAAMVITLFWGYLRTFYCWSDDYCSVENPEILTCMLCQADLVVKIFLGVGLAFLVLMLIQLFACHIDAPSDHDEKLVERAVGRVVGQRIHRSALGLGDDGPGAWTAVMAVLAVIVVAFLVFGPFNALWVF